MRGLVTDRTQANVLRRNELAAKGWNKMTVDEKMEWLGTHIDASGINLIPCDQYNSHGVSLKFTNDTIIATAEEDGQFLYAAIPIGDSNSYVGKTLTISLDGSSKSSTISGYALCMLTWYDESGYYPIILVGDELLSEATVTLTDGPERKKYLAVCVLVSYGGKVYAGDSARFNGLMLEFGETKHEYVPYTGIIPNNTTKGADNYSDLNRVERATAELSDLYGLDLETKTDWNVHDVPKSADMVRYITNIRKIRQACLSPNSIPAAPDSMNGLNFNDANNIEKILLAACENTDHICRVGELFSGEV